MDSSGRKNSHSLILVHRYEEELARQIETLEKYMERLINVQQLIDSINVKTMLM